MMNWLRNNEVKPGDVDGRASSTTISGVPMPTINMSPAEEEGYRRCDELVAATTPPNDDVDLL
jgi:hypothetical protein